MKQIKRISKLYIAVAMLVVLFVLVSEIGWLPTGYIALQTQSSYYVNLIAIVFTFGSVLVSHGLLSMNRVKQQVVQPDEAKGWSAYQHYVQCRVLVQALGMAVNAWLYYATISMDTPMYGLFVTAISFVFCRPSLSEYENMRHPSDEVPPRRDGLSL